MYRERPAVKVFDGVLITAACLSTFLYGISYWFILLTAALAIVFVFRFSLGAIDILVSNRKEAERERQIGEALSRGEKTVTLTNYFPNTGYALPFILDAPDDWVNVAVSSYYGLDTVYGVNPD